MMVTYEHPFESRQFLRVVTSGVAELLLHPDKVRYKWAEEIIGSVWTVEFVDLIRQLEDGNIKLPPYFYGKVWAYDCWSSVVVVGRLVNAFTACGISSEMVSMLVMTVDFMTEMNKLSEAKKLLAFYEDIFDEKTPSMEKNLEEESFYILRAAVEKKKHRFDKKKWDEKKKELVREAYSQAVC